MTHKYAILAAALVLGACSAGGPVREGTECNTHVCHVQVTVDAACNVRVNPNDLPVAPGNKNLVIQWQIAGGTFAGDGIELQGGNNANPEFDRWTVSAQVVTVVDHHRKLNVTYPYSVRVATGGATCPDFDPTIMN